MISLLCILGVALVLSDTSVLAVCEGPSCASEALGDELSLLQVNNVMNQHKAAEANDAEAPSIDVFSHEEVVIREGDMRLPTSTEKAEFLKATNMYRCMHGSDKVKWSDAVAQGASEYISPMTEMIHSKMYDVKPPAGPAAENLGKTSHIPTPAEQVARWGDEVANCADAPNLKDGCAQSVKAPCPVGNAKSDGSCHIGHFTALVWQGTKTIGCAYSKSTNPQLIICRYKAGDTKTEETPNMNKGSGAYPKHVFRKKKSKEQCGGTSGSGGSNSAPRVVSVRSVKKKKTPVAKVVSVSPVKKKKTPVASTATSCGKSSSCASETKCGECKSKCGGSFSKWKCARSGSDFTTDICEC